MNLLKDLKNLAHEKMGSSSEEEWYITVERAEGIDDKDKWSKSDTYVKMDFGGKNVKTHTINNSRTPYWNETFHFQVPQGKGDSIHIKLMDDDIGFDDSIGSATISKADLPTYSGEEKLIKVPVLRKDQATGLVHIRVKRVGGPSPPSYSQSQGVSNYSSNYPQQQQQQYSSQQQSYPSQQQYTGQSQGQYGNPSSQQGYNNPSNMNYYGSQKRF